MTFGLSIFCLLAAIVEALLFHQYGQAAWAAFIGIIVLIIAVREVR